MEKASVVGIAWYSEDDWKDWKKISGDELEDKFDDWLISASRAKSDLEESGFIVEKVLLKPGEFIKWCKKNKKINDSSSRSQFVTEQVYKKHTQ